jgi:hypothetical protein
MYQYDKPDLYRLTVLKLSSQRISFHRERVRAKNLSYIPITAKDGSMNVLKTPTGIHPESRVSKRNDRDNTRR